MSFAIDSQEHLVKVIKEFALQLQPHLNMANIDKIEDMLIHMEESDGGHEMKALIKCVRRQLTAKLSGYLDEEIEKHSQLSHIDADQQEKVVAVIFEKVQKSRQFLDCKQSIDHSVSEAVNQLLENFESEMAISHSKEPRPDFDHNSLTVSDDSSLSFSLTQTAFLFVGQEQLLQHAQGIQKQRTYTDRLENLRALSQMPVSDLLNAECWPLIRKGILESLVGDDDEKIWMAAFKCCTRGLSFNSPPSKDLYMLLIDYVHQTVMKKMPNWRISSGFDGQHVSFARFVNVMRILNKYQQQITNYWVRFSQERFLEEIVDATLGILVLQPNIELLSPYTIVAMIDPEAVWLRAWTHASFSRLPLFRILEKHRILVHIAVTCVLHYANYPKEIPSLSSDFKSSRNGSSGVDTHASSANTKQQITLRYSDAALQHLCLLSSMHILRYLLSYRQGTRFFPVRVRNEQITLKQFLIEIVRIISHPCAMINKPSYQPYNPSFVATDVLKHLCACTSVRSVIFSDEFISALLAPVCWNTSGNSGDSTAAEHYNNVLLLVAHVFSALAFDEEGKSHLMFGESIVRSAGASRPSSSSTLASSSSAKGAIHTLVRFVISNMNSEFLWRRVLGAYIYLCRQMYTSCHGLEIIKSYNLHKKLAEAKITSAAETKFAEMERSASATTLVNDDISGSDGNHAASRERSNSRGRLAVISGANLEDGLPTNDAMTVSSMGGVGNVSGRFSRERCGSSKPSLAAFWDETLKDNLLGFVSTPGGTLMLCQTGLFQECVSYMVQRYSSGVQMSKYEKYGYGSMVSQIAATLPGSEALAKSTPLISDFISNLWCKIETVPNEEALATPPPWSIMPIDRAQHKPFIRLLNVLSYPSIWFQLRSARLPNREAYTYRDQPRSFVELIDRIVFINSDAKVASLYNFEQSLTVGLRLLCSICTNLNSFVLLENSFSVVDMLLKSQRECYVEECNQFMLEEASILRNRILVWITALGGPSEKILPPYELLETLDVFTSRQYPLFGKLPLPDDYFIEAPAAVDSRSLPVSTHLASLTATTTNLDVEQVVQIRDSLLSWMRSKPNLFVREHRTVLQNVLLSVARSPNSSYQTPLPILNSDRLSKAKNVSGDGVDDNTLIVEMVVQYGLRLGVLNQSASTEELVAKLAKLLKMTNELLVEQQLPGKAPSHLSNSFDWFVAVVFLLFSGDSDAALTFLEALSKLSVSLLLWPKRSVNYAGLSDSFIDSGLTPLFAHTYHYVQWILQEQLPLVNSALKMSGVSCSQLCDQWLCQAFLNYLDLPEIFSFIVLCLTAGPDYVAYSCVALFDHMRILIAEAHHQQVVQLQIKERPLTGFAFCDHFDFMGDLERKYRKSLYAELETLFNDNVAK